MRRISRVIRDADWLPARLAAAWGPWLTIAIVLLVGWRLALMLAAPPIMPGETHVLGVVRDTFDSGSWLVPEERAVLAPTAEPPLIAWSTALSMAMFGHSDFAARLPAMVVGIVVAGVAAMFAGGLGMRSRWTVVPVLLTSPAFFAGIGMADGTMIEATVVFGAQFCGYRALTAASRAKGYDWRGGFWALAGIGALVDGLGTLVLIALPILIFLIYRRDVVAGAWRLCDRRSLVLGLMLCLPWFVEAERAHPGFLRACLLDRYLDGAYGTQAHGSLAAGFPGVILLFAIGGILPWVAVLGRMGTADWRQRNGLTPLCAYLWCCAVVPLLYRLASSSVQWADTVVAIPASAILAARWLDAAGEDRRFVVGLVASVIVIVGFLVKLP